MKVGRRARHVTGGLLVVFALTSAPGAASAALAPTRAATSTAAEASGANLSATASPMWQTNNTVSAIVAYGGDVFVGGEFTEVGPPGEPLSSQPTAKLVNQEYLAEFNASTGKFVASFDPVLNGPVDALAVDDGWLYVGGTFTSVQLPGQNPESVENLAAFNISQGGYPSLGTKWPASANSTVLTLATSPDGSVLYVGGDFGELDGVHRARAGAVWGAEAPDPGSLYSWAPELNASVTSIAVAPDDSRVLLGGYFTTDIGGVEQHGIESTDPAMGTTEPFAANIVPYRPPACTSAVKDIVISDVTGTLTAYVAAEGTGGGCFDGDFAATVESGTLLWQSDCLGATQALAVVGEWLYKGSHAHDCSYAPGGFPQVPEPGGVGSVLRHLLDQSLSNGTLGHWTPNTNNPDLGPRVLATDGTQLFVGGGFTTVNGQVQEGLTRFGPGVGEIAPPTPGKPRVVSTSKGAECVTFQAVSDPDVGSLEYVVYRSGEAKPVGVLHATSWPWALPVLHLWQRGLKPGARYSYRVRASTGLKMSKLSMWSVPVMADRKSSGESYDKTVIDAHPGFFWQLDQRSGKVAADTARGGFDGLYEPGTTLGLAGPIAGDPARAVGFNGSDGVVTSLKKVRGPKVFSVEAWFKTTTDRGGMLVDLGSLQTEMSPKIELDIYMMNDGQLVFGVWTGRTETIESTNVYNDGVWHYVVATMGPGGMAFYVDGQRIGTNPNSSVDVINGYWRIGGDNLNGWNLDPSHGNSQGETEPNSYYFQGVVADVATYMSALTASEVAAHFAAAYTA